VHNIFPAIEVYQLAVDISILNGPAEEATRDFLKAHDPKNMKPGSPLKCRYGK
jgi:hypothetical protein